MNDELSAIKEYLWPNQTGLPNEHRCALTAIKARERLLTAKVEKLIAALPNIHKLRAFARMFEDGEPMKRDMETWANNAERVLKLYAEEPTNADGLDRETFIEERVKELLSLGESWDRESATKEAETEWELQQEEYRDALGAD